jgi:hypothetical protein
MIAQRLVYTAREVRLLLGASDRTLRRWRKYGKHFHPWQDAEDPLKRWLYDAEEVEAYRRRHPKGSGAHKINAVGRGAPVKPWTLEPTLPGPVAGRVYARLKKGESIDDICDAEGVAPEQVIRLEQLRQQFEAERVRTPKPPSAPRMVTDESDPVIAALAKELDDERRRRTETGADDEGDDPEDEDEDEDEEGEVDESTKKRTR